MREGYKARVVKILSHRGYWKVPYEKNTREAFKRSFSLGFGTETDIRDHMGELVISHDMPSGGEMSFNEFLTMVASFQGVRPLTLALNIKADGLCQKVESALAEFPDIEAFVFDMALPDTRAYFAVQVPVFTRMSEVEREPVWLPQSGGVWLDAFESEWYDADVVSLLLSRGKQVCLVSPELHGRMHIPLWEKIVDLKDEPGLLICTDFPMDARDYFGIESDGD